MLPELPGHERGVRWCQEGTTEQMFSDKNGDLMGLNVLQLRAYRMLDESRYDLQHPCSLLLMD